MNNEASSYISNRTADGSGSGHGPLRCDRSAHERHLVQTAVAAVGTAVGDKRIGVRRNMRGAIFSCSVHFHLLLGHVLVVVFQVVHLQRLAERQLFGVPDPKILADVDNSRERCYRKVHLQQQIQVFFLIYSKQNV